MQESGIDISRHTSKTVDALPEKEFEFVITVCDNAKEHCPYFPATTKQFHRNFEDPTYAVGAPDEVMRAYRTTRDALKNYCEEFVRENL
jgi:arsenate reductase